MPSYSGRGIHGQVVEDIGRRIVQGAFQEGDTLAPDRLQLDYGVSLTVIREALKVLAGKGLVDARQRRGTFVQPRSAWNLLDPDLLVWEVTGDKLPLMLAQLGETRLIFEPAAAALAAERRNDDDLEDLHAALDAMEQAITPEEATEADIEFHRVLSACTKNDLLERVEMLTRSLFTERDRLVHEHVTDRGAIALHRALHDAIAAADPVAAREASEALLTQAVTDSAAYLTSHHEHADDAPPSQQAS